MTWSFDSALTASKDKVRFYCGDMDAANPLRTDETITFALTEEGNVRAAAALICESLAADYARKADSAVGDLQISYSQLFEQYTKQAANLRARSALYAAPYAGGISISRKDTVEADTDRVVPAFTVEMLSHPGSDTTTETDS